MKKYNNLQYIWLKSFLILILLLLLIEAPFLYWISVTIKKEAARSSNYSIDFLGQTLDSDLTSIQKLASDFIYRANLKLPLDSLDNRQAFKSHSAYEFVDNMKSLKTANAVIKDLCVYYPDRGYIVGTRGSYPAGLYYLLGNHLDKSGFSDWLNAVTPPNKQGFFTANLRGEEDLFYIKTLYQEQKNKEIYLIITIDRNEMQAILKRANKDRHQLAAILTESGKLYTFSGNECLVELAFSRPLEQLKNGYFEGSRYLVARSSQPTGYHYLLIMDKAEVLGILNVINRILLITLFLCLAGGTLASLYLASRNSRPMLSLLRHLKENGASEETDVYAFIRKRIDELMEQNESSMELLDGQMRIIKSSFVKNLLSCGYPDEQTVGIMADVYGITFENPWFCVIVISGRDGIGENALKSLENVLESVKSPDCAVYHSYFQDKLHVILNMEGTETGMQESIGRILELLTSPSNLETGGLTCTAGTFYDNPSKILYSYREALAAGEDRDLILYEENSKIMSEFQKNILSKDYSSALNMTDLLFDQYLGKADPVTLKYRIYGILNQLLDALKQEGQEGESNYYSDTSISRDYRTIILDLLSRLIDGKETPDQDKAFSIPRIKSFIEKNYSDPTLSLNTIANELGLSNSYVSRLFKRECQMGIVEYINRFRIEEAKKMLQTDSLNIKGVAIKVGFSSDISFIRVFKKYENVTPGKFTAD